MTNIFHEEIKDERLSFIYNSSIYNKVKIEDCDFILHNSLLWAESNTEDILKSLSKKYKSADKFVIVFVVNDEEKKYKFYKNLLIVRTSLKASRKKTNEIVMPYIWDCLNLSYSPARFEQPNIGFCGQNNIYRKKILNVFNESTSVKANFIIRENFWGGSPHDPKLIDDYNNNLKENPFIISQRGAGNFSIRFYQSLASGRIPVLVNTDMLLPFEDKISWNDYIVFERDEQACLKKVIHLFETEKYIKMQQDCYKLFDHYFSKDSFFKELINQIFRMFTRNAFKRNRDSW